jgi:anti-sigma factor RsiW
MWRSCPLEDAIMPGRFLAQGKAASAAGIEDLPTDPLFPALSTKVGNRSATADRELNARVNGQRARAGSKPQVPRSIFLTEALCAFERIIGEVSQELLTDGVISTAVDVGQMRVRVAQKLMQFASSGRTEIQIKQLPFEDVSQ